MERNGEQQTSKVLRSDRTRAKEAQQRNARMGQASGGDREDSGGLVRRSHVLTAKHSKRASLAARKKTGGGRKDQAGDDPQGSSSGSTLGAGDSRGHQGNHPLCGMGVSFGDVLARLLLRFARTEEIARIRSSCGADPGVGYWRQYCGF